MHANHAFHRAFRAEYLKSIAQIERRADCGDKYPVATEIGSLMCERDRLRGGGYHQDADILDDVINALGERMPYDKEYVTDDQA